VDTIGFSGSGVALAPIAISPDGRRLTFIARNSDGRRTLWLRSLDAVDPQMLAGTDGAASPFWSPDGRFIGFFADGKLKKIDMAGGPATIICDAPNGIDGTWGREGTILFGIISPEITPLLKVAAGGGIAAPATTVLKDEGKHIRPAFLPDGRHFLFRLGTNRRATIVVGSIDSNARTSVLEADSTNVQYSGGHLLFMRETTLMAQPFDARRLALTGEPFPIVDPVLTLPSASATFAMYSASENGVLVYQLGAAAARPRLAWRDWQGQVVATVGEPAAYADLALSPDGKQAAVSLAETSARDIWIVDLVRGLRTRFTFDPADDVAPVWSPDGRQIVFASRRRGHFDLYVKASSGAGAEELLLADDREKLPTSWSSDGRLLVFSSGPTATGTDIWVLPLTGDRKPYVFLATRFQEGQARLSPDGRFAAYFSTESGRGEVYVAPFPTPSGKWQVSTTGGMLPHWQPDGQQIVFRDFATGQLTRVAVRTGETSVTLGESASLFSAVQGGARNYFEIAPDGKRILVNAAAPPLIGGGRPMNVVVNWPASGKK
jgi:Tol biopolymer transport system component